MADNEETFDPNDLDSIDALLDEAEQSANDDIGDEASEAADPLDSLLDEAEAVETSEEEVSVEPESEEAAEPEPVELEAAAKTVEQDKGAKKEAVPDADEFIAKRAEAARSDPKQNMVQNKDMAAADMDAIKKLIIIVGSVLSVLAITGIGIGVWGALAASSSGVDEETLLVIESTQARAVENGVVALESGKAVKSLSIKMDSLNSLLEGLSADIAKIEAQAVEEQEPLASTEHGKVANGHAAKTKPGYADSALMDKVTSVNGKMIKAQRRIDEVNRRVKSIQQQYTALLHSVKTVEKQFIEQQAAIEAEKAAEEEKPKFSAEGYEYMPNGMSYDESVGDSYP